MRILVVHNRYQHSGGEDSVYRGELDLLRSGGHEVESRLVSNDDLRGIGSQISAALLAAYNPAGRAIVADAIASFRPDLVHVHNFFPRLSPAVFWACDAARVPSVWTVHNFRVACASGLLFRDGHPCEDCLGNAPFPAIRHRCYRGSLPGSTAVAAMIAAHKLANTWDRRVTRFIALTEFARSKLLLAGIPAERVVVKPNFVETSMPLSEARTRHGVLYVGRLSPEKGVSVLLEAWRGLDVPLTIIGDGPERASLASAAPSNVHFVGRQDRQEVLRHMASAAALVVPSIWYETFGLVAIEAMAMGLPPIVSRLGSLAELVTDGETGFHFTAGDPASLAAVLRSAFADRTRLESVGRAAAAHCREHFSPQANLTRLEQIYAQAIDEVKR